MLALAVLTSCGRPPTAFPPTPGPDTCNASAYQYLLGQPADATNQLPQPKRVYHITDAVTQDYVAERLNAVLDDSGTIGAITCG